MGEVYARERCMLAAPAPARWGGGGVGEKSCPEALSMSLWQSFRGGFCV